jgi:hypothetical protein
VKILFCSAALAVTLAAAAQADIIMVLETKNMTSETPTTATQEMTLTADKLSGHIRSGGQEQQMIYRGDKKLLWMIDPGTKAYMELTEAGLAAMGEQVNAEMKQGLAQLPADQRAQAEAMLKSRMGEGAKAPVIDAKNTGEKKTVEGHACTKWDLFRDGQKSGEAWVAPRSEFKVTPADFQVFASMVQFFDNVRKSMPVAQELWRNGDTFAMFQKIDGVPVVTRRMDGDKVLGETTLKTLDRKTAPATEFALPAGYTAQSIGGPGR